MNRAEAYDLFREMIDLSEVEIARYVRMHPLQVDRKADSTVVTGIDRHLDSVLSTLAKEHGLHVVSEEGPENLDAVRRGDYCTLDTPDGTLGLIEHIRCAEGASIRPHVAKDLGPEYDYALLVGIVENGQPRFGCAHNFVTGETVLLSAEGPEHTVRTGSRRDHDARCAQYIELRTNDGVNARIARDPDVKQFLIAAYGLRALHAQIDGHESAVAVHRAQASGLWDILPAAVAAQWSGAMILDDRGDPFKYDTYLIAPGHGISTVIGERFTWVPAALRD